MIMFLFRIPRYLWTGVFLGKKLKIILLNCPVFSNCYIIFILTCDLYLRIPPSSLNLYYVKCCLWLSNSDLVNIADIATKEPQILCWTWVHQHDCEFMWILPSLESACKLVSSTKYYFFHVCVSCEHVFFSSFNYLYFTI